MKRSEDISLLSKALVAAQAEMGNAVKDSKNPFFKSKYADINSIREAAIPVLSKHGLAILQPPENIDGKNFIETMVVHESGQYITSLNEVIVGKQNDPQSYLAAQTYTRRGALQAFLNMGSEDDDGNALSGRSATPVKDAGPSVTPKATMEKLSAAAESLGLNTAGSTAPAEKKGFGSRFGNKKADEAKKEIY